MREHNCSAAAAPSHTCQWEKSPEGMAKLLAQFRSAAMRHNASTAAMAAAGVRSAATARAIRRLLRRFLATLEPLVNRILTRMAL
jgi:hypothetical protein